MLAFLYFFCQSGACKGDQVADSSLMLSRRPMRHSTVHFCRQQGMQQAQQAGCYMLVSTRGCQGSFSAEQVIMHRA